MPYCSDSFRGNLKKWSSLIEKKKTLFLPPLLPFKILIRYSIFQEFLKIFVALIEFRYLFKCCCFVIFPRLFESAKPGRCRCTTHCQLERWGKMGNGWFVVPQGAKRWPSQQRRSKDDVLRAPRRLGSSSSTPSDPRLGQVNLNIH